MPRPAPSGADVAGVEGGGEGAERGGALGPQLGDEGRQRTREGVGVGADGFLQGRSALAGAAERFGAVGVARRS